ncbi:unnamed protein product [Adineta ricciae]|uniref:Methyltransferase type 11 domain-containing protein n=1 Tax=Adineta ricciae TaxID=249248 RepID=A0A815VLS3_ADIRI|nr:unnamed protein product [Adineta ricciae]
MKKIFIHQIEITPPTRPNRLTPNEIACARQIRLRELRMWKITREIIFYISFLSLLSVIVYSNHNENASFQVRHLRKSFSVKISSMNEYWEWLEEDFVGKIRAHKWYNGKNVEYLRGYLNDTSNRLLGWALMKQSRIRTQLCPRRIKFVEMIFCERVIGTDVSADQISHAISKDNVEYRCSPGEDLSFLESNSVDLITIATALHWLDVEKFFQEVKRVLKPQTGVLAVWTYTFGSLDNSDADIVYKEFHQTTLQPYQNERQYIINAYYEPLLAIFPYKSSLEQYTIEFRAEATLEQFLGTLETASPAQTYRKQNGEQKYQEMFNTLRQKFIQSYLKSEGQNDNEQPIDANHIKITHLRPIRLYLVRKTD